MTYEFTIPGEPIAQKRARSTVVWINGKPQARVYDDPSVSQKTGWKGETRSFLAAELARMGIDPPLFGSEPLQVDTLFVFTCPKSLHRKTIPRPRSWHAKKPDLDNVRKALLDAAKGVLWIDDKQIVSGSTTKIVGAQGEAPYTLLWVREADSFALDNWTISEQASLFGGS